LVHPRSPNHRPSSHGISLVSIGPLNQSSWVSGGRRGGSVPVGAMPERREAPRDLPVAKEVEQRGFLERFVTQRTVHRIAGEFNLSTGSFSQKTTRARVRALRMGRLVLARAARCWAMVARVGPCCQIEFSIFLSESSSLLFHVND
jgi:hypothetical protein